MSTKERLQAKLKAQGKTTAEEKDLMTKLTTTKGQELLAQMFINKATAEDFTGKYPDYALDFLSFGFYQQFPKQVRRFAEMVVEHHDGEDIPLLLLLDIMDDKHIPEEKKLAGGAQGGFWVLRHRGKIVCVATMCGFYQLTYLTTMKDERRKGHATFLLNQIRERHEQFGFVSAAIFPHLLPLFERSGWVRPNDRTNKDDSIDVVPSYAVSKYDGLYTTAGRKAMMEKYAGLPLLSATPSAEKLIREF